MGCLSFVVVVKFILFPCICEIYLRLPLDGQCFFAVTELFVDVFIVLYNFLSFHLWRLVGVQVDGFLSCFFYFFIFFLCLFFFFNFPVCFT